MYLFSLKIVVESYNKLVAEHGTSMSSLHNSRSNSRTKLLDEKRKEKKTLKDAMNSRIKYYDEDEAKVDREFHLKMQNNEDVLFSNYSDTEIIPMNKNFGNERNVNLRVDASNNLFEGIMTKYNFCRCSKAFSLMLNKLQQKNTELFYENLDLRKQLLQIKAENISHSQN